MHIIRIKKQINYLIIIMTTLILLAPGNGRAKSNNFGLGIMVGEPTGISFKSWKSPSTAIDGGIGWGFGKDGFFNVHADYLIHRSQALKNQTNSLPVYFGIGAKLNYRDDEFDDYDAKTILGVRIPLGLAAFIKDTPVDIFAEIVPGLILLPETDFDLDVSLGIRYYFNL